MGWNSTTNRNMPCIQNYARAQMLWDRIKPLRGRDEGSDRPLDKRLDRARWIGKRGDTFVAKLYQTDVVSYHPDGRVVLNIEGWATHATADFMNAVAPVQAQLFDGRVWAHMNGKHYIVSNTLTIKQDDQGKWQPHNPIQTERYQLNKEKCKALRTSFKPLVTYADAMFKLSERKPNRWGANLAAFDIADEGTYYEVFRGIEGNDMKSFRRNLWHWAYHRYECWETIPVPLGELARWYK